MVSSSLSSGLSGLKAHSRYIDVIGNNLANVSTPGFWGSRTTFSDILSFTLTPGSGPQGNLGGKNPVQIGLGVGVGSIDLMTQQGTFQDTARSMDVALQGSGFFTLTNGQQNFYTRVGSFNVDGGGQLVDTRTGYQVVSTSGSPITVPITDTLPPSATTEITLKGNLPAEVGGPLAEIFQSEEPLKSGTPATLSSTPPTPTFDMSPYMNNGASISVMVNGKGAQSVTFTSASTGWASPANAITQAQLVSYLSTRLSGDLNITAGAGSSIDVETIAIGEDATVQFNEGADPDSAGILTALGFSEDLQTGTETALTSATAATTSLNALTGLVRPYANGERLRIQGNQPDNSPINSIFTYGAGNDGTTVQDLLDFVNTRFNSTASTGATASIDGSGNLVLTANSVGPAEMSLSIEDAGASTNGSIIFPNMLLNQDGSGPDTHTTSIDVFDSVGSSHPVTLTFTRDLVDPQQWSITASMDPSEGTITDDFVDRIRFNSDGSLETGTGDLFQFVFNNTGGAGQSVTLDIGTASAHDGLVMTGNRASAAATDQDGYAAGELLDIAFNSEGELAGQYTNGQTQILDQLRIAIFSNPMGLLRQGNTLFVEAPNSDNPVLTTAGTSGAGVVRAGALENSNVDIASEFVKLIEAQRGFQASSRVITTTDEILAELINIVR